MFNMALDPGEKGGTLSFTDDMAVHIGKKKDSIIYLVFLLKDPLNPCRML